MKSCQKSCNIMSNIIFSRSLITRRWTHFQYITPFYSLHFPPISDVKMRAYSFACAQIPQMGVICFYLWFSTWKVEFSKKLKNIKKTGQKWDNYSNYIWMERGRDSINFYQFFSQLKKAFRFFFSIQNFQMFRCFPLLPPLSNS